MSGLRGRNLRRYALVPCYPLLWPVAYAVPRRRTLWLFGNSPGFKDNPRYLFEHVLRTRPPGIEAVWIAQSRTEARAVRRLGGRALWKRSPRAWWSNLRCGVVVLGHGPSDLNRPLIGRAMTVQLWHGAPFKRLHADFPAGDVLLGGSGTIARIGNAIVRRATNATRSVDLMPSQSQVVARRFQSAFGIGPEATPVIGTPRADVINRSGQAADAEARACRQTALPARLGDAHRLVLYAPTWRDGNSESFLADGLDIPALDALLDRHDAAMLIRLHPQGDPHAFDDTGLPDARRIAMSHPAEVDINIMLRAVDCLLTDYSATSIDYAVLGRPIVYFMPDLGEYEAGRGLYESPSALTDGLHCATWPDVLAALDAALAPGPDPYTAAAEQVGRRFFDHHDTENCARITAEILRRQAGGSDAAERPARSSSA